MNANHMYIPTGTDSPEKRNEKHVLTNEQIREGGYMEDIVKATEHEMGLPEIDPQEAYKVIEETVVTGYKTIEEGVVSGYKKIEEGAVSGFTKLTDKFVEKLFAKEGESVEDAKKRLQRKQ